MEIRFEENAQGETVRVTTLPGGAVVRELVRPEVDAPALAQEVSALAALAAIDEFGLAPAYTAWATAPERTFLDRAFIDKAQRWKRDNPVLAQAAADLGLTPAQMDAMFARAAELDAIL